jgi:hypothetical protein
MPKIVIQKRTESTTAIIKPSAAPSGADYLPDWGIAFGGPSFFLPAVADLCAPLTDSAADQ